ncbi:metallophosphoesterase [Mesorhizobium sp.]|uniref:metallophosphoesterase family protein n=1 Tax=Mesorhizobium sp. TaxID=1871066 RepID=UPI0011F4D561|nr:metallophosphoesterase [Mesorhizobium sp.]TIN83080.1 MAG: hypothetical protein E5X97_27495 [Mesorhizobium sp.]
MTTVRLIGDVHGKFGRYRELIRYVPFSIQAGDMGVGFRGYRHGELKWLTNPPYDAMSEGRHLFIRGNHDNPDVCSRHDYWIKDGTTVEGIYCLGGAVSIDRAWRTEGLDWWSDEECSYADLERMIDEYSALKPEIVVTHECPESIANEMLSAFGRKKFEDGSRTRQALERMFHLHQPREWYFGHWHVSLRFMSGRTTFQCLNELEYADVEI